MLHYIMYTNGSISYEKKMIIFYCLLSVALAQDIPQTLSDQQQIDRRYIIEESKKLQATITSLNKTQQKWNTRRKAIKTLRIHIKAIDHFISKVRILIGELTNTPEANLMDTHNLKNYEGIQKRLARYQAVLCQNLAYIPSYIHSASIVSLASFNIYTIIQEINTLNRAIELAYLHRSFVYYIIETEECSFKLMEFRMLYLKKQAKRHIGNINATLKSENTPDPINQQLDPYDLEIVGE